MRSRIRKKTGCGRGPCGVRRMPRVPGFPPERPVTEYAPAAGDQAAGRRQADAAGTIPGARRRGPAVAVQDEPVFARMGANGKKTWPRVGDPVTVRRSGRRDGTVAYGALAGYGTRPMRRYESSDGPAFAGCPSEVRRRRGRVLATTDGAIRHKARAVREYLKGHPGVGVPYLPAATPKLGAAGAAWKEAKCRPAASEHCETLEGLTHAAPGYFRTCPIRPDIYKFPYRSI